MVDRRRRVRACIAAAFTPMLLMTMAARAAAESLSLHPYATVDVFLPGNGGKGLKDGLQSTANQLAAQGYSGNWSVDTNAGYGFRAGAQAPITDCLDVGLSGGFIWGPNSNANISAARPGQFATVGDARSVYFIRFLVEPTLNAPLGANSAFHLGTGIGVAQGSVKDAYSGPQNVVGSGRAQSYSANWTGLTWEVSPYVSIADAVLGVRYAWFPTFNGTANQYKMQWNSLGFFAGTRY